MQNGTCKEKKGGGGKEREKNVQEENMKNGGVHAADREGERVAGWQGMGTRREGGRELESR